MPGTGPDARRNSSGIDQLSLAPLTLTLCKAQLRFSLLLPQVSNMDEKHGSGFSGLDIKHAPPALSCLCGTPRLRCKLCPGQTAAWCTDCGHRTVCNECLESVCVDCVGKMNCCSVCYDDGRGRVAPTCPGKCSEGRVFVYRCATQGCGAEIVLTANGQCPHTVPLSDDGLLAAPVDPLVVEALVDEWTCSNCNSVTFTLQTGR